jgi:hypothetical protein
VCCRRSLLLPFRIQHSPHALPTLCCISLLPLRPHFLRCSQLHEHYYELPAPIREYIQEVKAQLAMLTDWPEAGIEVEEKLSFFKETRHAYGRTALLLSGGGGLGSFHLVSCEGFGV